MLQMMFCFCFYSGNVGGGCARPRARGLSRVWPPVYPARRLRWHLSPWQHHIQWGVHHLPRRSHHTPKCLLWHGHRRRQMDCEYTSLTTRLHVFRKHLSHNKHLIHAEDYHLNFTLPHYFGCSSFPPAVYNSFQQNLSRLIYYLLYTKTSELAGEHIHQIRTQISPMQMVCLLSPFNSQLLSGCSVLYCTVFTCFTCN